MCVKSSYNFVPVASAQFEKAELDRGDLTGAFTRFGQLNKVSLTRDSCEAYIFFNSFLNAYICYKTLRQCQLRGGSMVLMVDWVNTSSMHPEMVSEVSLFINGLDWHSLLEVKR